MNISIALAIPHAAHKEGRELSLQRLKRQLMSEPAQGLPWELRIFQDKESCHVWSHRIWTWGCYEAEATHFLTLQDDNILIPDFWLHLENLIRAYPGDVIGLRSFHPIGASLDVPTYTSSDALSGEYVIPTKLLSEFLEWRKTCNPAVLAKVPEDTLLATWCQMRRIRIRHTSPALIDHDTSLPSTYGELGNDTHLYRRPSVPFTSRNVPEEGWALEPGQEDIHVGRLWSADNPIKILTALGHTPSAELEAKIHGDTGDAISRRLVYARAASQPFPQKLWIGVPVANDGIHPETALSIFQLIHQGLALQFDSTGIQCRGDLLLARAKLLNAFRRSDATHALLIDSGNAFPPHLIAGMLACGKDLVLAPYPSRGAIHLDRVKALGHSDEYKDGRGPSPTSVAYDYKLRKLPGSKGVTLEPNAPIWAIAGAGLGVTLLSRQGFERMCEIHKDNPIDPIKSWDEKEGSYLNFFDPLTMPEVDGHPMRLRDDYAFCQRALEAGIQPYLYLGPGAPAVHFGEHAYAGAIEAFGVSHVKSR